MASLIFRLSKPHKPVLKRGNLRHPQRSTQFSTRLPPRMSPGKLNRAIQWMMAEPDPLEGCLEFMTESEHDEPKKNSRANGVFLMLSCQRRRIGRPLSVEAQVAALYRLGHGLSHVTSGHVFNIGKETADKVSGRFVNAILEVFRKRVVRWAFIFTSHCLSRIGNGEFKRRFAVLE
ncbi:uncharacterized protein VP01_1905g6 [Puccinia sorghi]|uniref:Uncharacterized protein n=1 Tax=Puccinia sorghi TaxID=27349 RepID=A0A0L6VCW9_9BASI|nr:uncharacterized protein VP01_1905g6 [Puccinia sorghi]